MLLAILFVSHCTFAQIPKLFLKFVEKQNKIQSGYVKFQCIYVTDNDTTGIDMYESFFISTPQDLKHLTNKQDPYGSDTYCKSARTAVKLFRWKDIEDVRYRYNDKIYDAKRGETWLEFPYSTPCCFYLEGFKDGTFQRISPKISKKNIRYKILYPDDDISSNISQEWEFDRKTLNWIQEGGSATYLYTEVYYSWTNIFEHRFYEYIHPDILDTISFKFEELKKGYDRQRAEEQAKKDSLWVAHLTDSIVRSITQNGGTWSENMPQDIPQEKQFFMPEWNFPLLSGDTLYSDSIKSQYLLIDMWYVACHPCRLAMLELSSIDTLYDESLLKIISLNVSDKDTAKINRVIRNLNLKSDVVCAVDHYDDILNMSKKMGNCQGYPQLYLIEMKTKQVIWRSCGWYAGFTKDIEAIIKDKSGEEQ